MKNNVLCAQEIIGTLLAFIPVRHAMQSNKRTLFWRCVMAIFKRIRDIISASINDMLDGVEDPEKMVNQIIREMEKSIAEMRKNTASAIATRKSLEKKLQRAETEVESWQKNAEIAIEQKDDELAKKALLRKKEIENRKQDLAVQLKEGTELAEKLREELSMLEDKVQEARAKRETLLTKKRAAETRQKLANNTQKIRRHIDRLSSAESIIRGFESFEKFEENIELQVNEAEARAELQGDGLEDNFNRIKRDQAVEDELADLKARMSKKSDSGKK